MTSEAAAAERQPAISFGRVLRLGSYGKDVLAVQRALARAGYGKLSLIEGAPGVPLFGPKTMLNLRGFQKSKEIEVDGVYGPLTHRKLAAWFDDYSFLLYTGRQPHPKPVMVLLPQTFRATHQTAGLPGYPAIDVFGPPGASVGAPEDGTVTRLSGHDPREGGNPGGAYGWSIYLTVSHGEYFLTHFGSRTVGVGQKVKRGEKLGTVCDAKVARMSSDLSHIHEGKRTL